MPYRPEFWPEWEHGIRVGMMGVLDMCLELHMDHTGSFSSLPQERRELYVRCLRHCLLEWRPNSNFNNPSTVAFDTRVRELVIATLEERNELPEWVLPPAPIMAPRAPEPKGPEGDDSANQARDERWDEL